jgi:hypothetical protein
MPKLTSQAQIDEWYNRTLPNGAAAAEPEPAPAVFLPSFPEIAWRGIFDTYRRAMECSTEASDVVHFVTIWTSIAAAIGRRAHVRLGSIVYPNVFLNYFGPSADKKTTAQRRLVHCDLLGGHGVKIIQGTGSTEGIGDMLTSSESGVYLFFWEEFATFLAQAHWKGSTLLEFITETFDCPHEWKRDYRKNPIYLKTPTPNILTATTTEWFWKNARLEDFYGGFANRFLHFTGTRKPLNHLPEDLKPELVFEVKQTLQDLAKRRSRRIEWTPAAEVLWKEFYHRFESTERKGLLAVAVKRVQVYVMKLAMTYAYLEDCDLDTEHLHPAIAVGEYAAQCAALLCDMQATTHKPTADLEVKFLDWVRKYEGRSVRQMQMALSRYCGDAETFNRILKSLVQSDQIETRSELGKRRVYLPEP